MDIESVKQKFHLFYQSSSILNERAKHYLPRFNYSACELWLCTELCHLINFEGHNLQVLSGGDIFLYNEDYKRDLTLYSSGKTDQPKILSHMEVKVIYPVTRSKYNDSIENLYQKLKNSLHFDYSQEGWIYFVWTQHYVIPPAVFFASRVEWLKEHLASKAFIDHENNQLTPVYTQVQDISEGTITWRGEEKKIVVKAMAFSFIKNFREITRK